MTDEEYFRKNYPDSCYGDKPLSPHWDFFQDGVEFGERQSEKKIADLEKENAELKEQCSILADCNTCVSDCKTENIEIKKQLTKAKEIIKYLLSFIQKENYKTRWDINIAEAEQFLNSEV